MSTLETVSFWDDRSARSTVAERSEAAMPNHLDRAVAFFGPVKGRRVLDIGCGLGENAIAMARLGATVTAIDTSSVAVEKVNAFARENGLDITAVVHSAMEIDRLGGFDFVIGAMILHHLEPFEEFANVLHAALQPGGKAFFHENNAASRLLVWSRQNLAGRLGIPKYGDAEEFPLTPQEVDMLRAKFRVVQEFPEMLLFGLVSVYLLRRRAEPACRRIDRLLHDRNILRSYSYRQILFLERAESLATS